jgi:hypothetical protein
MAAEVMRQLTIPDDAEPLRGPTRRRLGDALREARVNGTTTQVVQDGTVVALLVDPASWHDPSTCCCKNCPWGGDHNAQQRREQS